MNERVHNAPSGYLTLKEVRNKTGHSQSGIYRMIREGTFPASYKFGERKSAWKTAEIEAWINGRDTLGQKSEAIYTARKPKAGEMPDVPPGHVLIGPNSMRFGDGNFSQQVLTSALDLMGMMRK